MGVGTLLRFSVSLHVQMAGLYGLRVGKLWSIKTFRNSESKQQGKFDQKWTESRAQETCKGMSTVFGSWSSNTIRRGKVRSFDEVAKQD